MSGTKTPRTDAEATQSCDFGLRSKFVVPVEFARELEREINRLRAERDEARRDRCMARAVIRWDIEHPNSPQRSQTTIILLAWQIADEEGWDCFNGRKR